MPFKKGNVGYFKGKHFSEEHKRNISEANKGKIISEETQKKMSVSAKKRMVPEALQKNWEKGKITWMKGKHHTPESKLKLSKARKGMKLSKEWKDKIGQASLGNKSRTGQKNSPGSLKKFSEKMKGRMFTDEHRHKIFQALEQSPNKAEIKLMYFLQKILPNEYKFVGDGSFFIHGKNPDFVSFNNNKIIELYGLFWHIGLQKIRKEPPHNPQDRIDFFKRYGYSTLVIWEHELKSEDSLRDRIDKFQKEAF
jgi:G:T-mismatch repair DNA endonuclease (very short patch repair protein)